jgi:hypothetical protein
MDGTEALGVLEESLRRLRLESHEGLARRIDAKPETEAGEDSQGLSISSNSWSCEMTIRAETSACWGRSTMEGGEPSHP